MIPTLGITASATSNVVSTESEAVISVEEKWGNPGKTVDLDLILAENPGILGATITISWDESLTLIADASGEAFNHMTYTSPSRYVASGTNFVWFGNEVDEAIDGTILTLTFQVSEAAHNNDILPVRVTYTQGDVIDENDNDVTLNITDGHIRVITYQPGDITGDGRVNARDLVRLSQFISDGCKTDPDGYNAEVVADACDVNGDGRVNARDLIKLSQYISDGSQTNPDGYNAVLKPAKIPECQHSNVQETPAKAAGCTYPGNIAYWYCSDCGKYFGDDQCTVEISLATTIISSTGHTEVIDEAVAATCTQTGLTEGKHCSVCNEILVAQSDVPMIDHTAGAMATCTEDQTCTICGEILESANGHIPGVEASCTESQRCTVCQEVLADAIGHSLNYVAERGPVDANDPGNRAYWQCSVCNRCYLDEDATQEIALADIAWETYLVYFFDLENDTYTVGAYKKSEVLSLKNITPAEMKGYDFNGWHTNENFTEQNKISVIPAGNAQTVNLYANRSLHEYKITLLGLGREESWSYNIVYGIKLTTPKWKESAGEGDCLIFSHWSDENGNKITEIPAGEIGNRTIEANWIYKENYAVSNKDKYTYVNGVIDQYGRYSFIYEIGVIKDIVLSKQHSYTFDGLTEHTEAETKTYTVGASAGQEVAKTISKIVSSSTEMANISKHTTSHTDGWDVGAKWKPEIEIEGIKVSAWEFSGGYSNSDTDVYEDTGFSSEKNFEENGTENEVRSTIDYYTEESVSRTVSETFIPGVTPIGNYTWARLMDVKVYAIVTYNPYTGNYVFDIYSAPANIHDGLLYTLPTDLEYDINVVSGDVLDFEIPFEDIPKMFYTVEYDANGGIGEMPKSVHELGVSSSLFEKKFTKDGYTFNGWNTSPDGKGVTYTDNFLITSDIAAAGETVTLYAQWIPTPYTVKWNNVTGCTIKVERTSSPNGKASLGTLNSGDTVYYGDEVKVTYTADAAYTITKKGKSTITVGDHNVTTSDIYATAAVKSYSVNWNKATGCTIEVSRTSSPHKGATTGTLNSGDTVYYGDKLNITYTAGAEYTITSNGKTSITVSGNVTASDIYATAIRTSFTVNYSPTAVAWNGKEGASINLGEYVDLNSLKTLGYTKVTLVQEFTVTKTSNDKNAYVCSQVCFDAYDGVLWVNSPSDVTGGRRYTNIHYFTGGESVANLKWTNTRDLNGHTTIYFAFSSYNPWSIFNGYQCSYNISDHKVTIIFSK